MTVDSDYDNMLVQRSSDESNVARPYGADVYDSAL